MRTDKKPVGDSNKPQVPQAPYSPPERRFTTAWVLSDGGLFWVDIGIVGPIPEESKDYFTLRYRKAKREFKAISDIVEFLKEQLSGQDPVG